jgi:hypothetical protein
VERGELDRGGAELPGLSRAALLDTPDPALNQTFAWAVRRDPSGVRAHPIGFPTWDRDDYDELQESAATFRRVGTAAGVDPGHFLHQVVAGLFGVRSEGAGGRFEMFPWLPESWRTMALRRLRCHRTLLDLEVRARAEWVTLRFERSFGPAIPIATEVRNRGAIAQLTVDEIPVEGGQAVFTLQEQHEVTFFLKGET